MEPTDERTPLLAVPPSTATDDRRTDPRGSKRFPFHPHARATPRWRKLLLWFFDGHRDLAEVSDADVWPLEPQARAQQAARAVQEAMPAEGSRCRLLRALWAVHRTRLLRMILWNALAMALSTARPLLLWRLSYVDPMAVDESKERRQAFGQHMAIGGTLVAIVLVEVAVWLVTARSHMIATRVSLHVAQSLSKMVVDHAIRPNQEAGTNASVQDGVHALGRKERLVQMASMHSNDLRSISYFISVGREQCVLAMQLAVSVAVLFNVVKISWTVIGVVGVVYTVALMGQLALSRFSTPYERMLQVGRLSTLYNSLKNIQMAKLSACEDKILAKIQHARSKERAVWTRASAARFFLKHIVDEIPAMVAVLAFASSSSRGQTLTPLRVLAGMVLVIDCRFCAASFFPSLNLTLGGLRAFRQLDTYLQSNVGQRSNTNKSVVAETSPGGDCVAKMDGVCIAHASVSGSGTGQLLDVTWSLRKGDLTIIHGSTGAGKSLLLAALRGDQSASIRFGSFHGFSTNTRVAYCSQDPWLQNLSIRENILFGSPFDRDRYWAVIDACGLLEDLDTLAAGDWTIVGPRGINLSSGQSARVALARACYVDADVYLLDCPLANVDAVVQSEIFQKCILKMLMFKTVVIVTHNPEYIGSSYVDQLVEVSLSGVRVSSHTSCFGKTTYREMRESTTRATRRTRDQFHSQSRANDRSIVLGPLSQDASNIVERIEKKPYCARKLLHEGSSGDSSAAAVSKSTVREYFLGDQNTCVMRLMIALMVSLLWIVMCIIKEVWIINWASIHPENGLSRIHFTEGIVRYGILATASITLAVASALSVLAFNAASVEALIRQATQTVVHTTMTFYYQTRIGAIINRYQWYMSVLDKGLPTHVRMLMLSVITFLAQVAVLGWILGPAAVCVMTLGGALVARCVSAVFDQQLARLTFLAQADKLSLLSEVLDGEDVIRAFGNESLHRMAGNLEEINERLARSEYMSEVFYSHTILSAKAAMTLLELSLITLLAVRPITLTELVVASFYVLTMAQDLVPCFPTGLANTWEGLYNVEQLRQLRGMPIESETIASGAEADSWPQAGQIMFESVCFAYVDSSVGMKSQLALRDVTFSLRAGEKVGVVGRTGSGKSSIAMALLRVHPLQSGRILIDGVNLRAVHLAHLRRSITVVPQSPIFYRCSLREYMDPFDEFDDGRLWRELLTVGLGRRVQSLDEELLDDGVSWSLGQRQLLCFARALLKPARVVMLDEAFSCVDQPCQETILRIVHERLKSSTVLLITHRLDQILNFDRILVLNDGRLVENGSAVELARDAGSLFYEFLETSLLTK